MKQLKGFSEVSCSTCVSQAGEPVFVDNQMLRMGSPSSCFGCKSTDINCACRSLCVHMRMLKAVNLACTVLWQQVLFFFSMIPKYLKKKKWEVL